MRYTKSLEIEKQASEKLSILIGLLKFKVHAWKIPVSLYKAGPHPFGVRNNFNFQEMSLLLIPYFTSYQSVQCGTSIHVN